MTGRRIRVALVDYGGGNAHSLGKALERAGADVTFTGDWSEALACDALVLPGVGAFGESARRLAGHTARVRSALENGLPCLGICLGMQVLFESSEEADGEGVGLLAGRVRRMDAAVLPQMGWNDVATTPDPLFEGVDGLVAYYANSFVCEPADEVREIAWSEYEGVRFLAGLRRGWTWGVQFHPEKSSAQGRRIIANFLRLAVGATRRGRTARGGVSGGGLAPASPRRRGPEGS